MGCVVPRCAEYLKLVVPRRSERNIQLASHLSGICVAHRIPHAFLRHHDTPGGINLCVMDPQLGCVHPTPAEALRRWVLGHLEPQVLPATDGRGDRGTVTRKSAPRKLSAPCSSQSRLVLPGEVYGATNRAPDRPLQVGAQRFRGRVDEYHSARQRCRHDLSVSSGAASPPYLPPRNLASTFSVLQPLLPTRPAITTPSSRDVRPFRPRGRLCREANLPPAYPIRASSRSFEPSSSLHPRRDRCRSCRRGDQTHAA